MEAKPSAIARFLYEVIFRHRCMQVHINNQRMEFVHEVSKVLHNMIGTEQCIISAYRPQSNGLKKRQNKNIEELLLKVLDGNPCDWPNIINLFTHRVSKHHQNFLHSFLCTIGCLLYQSMSSIVYNFFL